MKKLIFLFLLMPLFIVSCSSDSNDSTEQDYTSFQIKSNEKTGTYRNVVAGYRLADNTLKKIADLGDIAPGASSEKIRVEYNTVKEVEIFFDAYNSNGTYGNTYRIANITLKEGSNSIHTIQDKEIGGAKVNKELPTEYPQ